VVVSAGDWQTTLEAAGELTPQVVEELLAAHGERGRTAIDALSEQRVKGYKDFTVVVGHAAEYIVEDGGCTCKDATYNLDPEDPSQRCWHALAVDIAEQLDAVDRHDMWYAEVREFLGGPRGGSGRSR
jgi:predicted nucleic acid-binding Zn finger protein